jgi:hypothetical protein
VQGRFVDYHAQLWRIVAVKQILAPEPQTYAFLDCLRAGSIACHYCPRIIFRLQQARNY